MLLGLFDDTDRLDGQHGKYAGHQIQDQAAQHGEQHEYGQRVLRLLGGIFGGLGKRRGAWARAHRIGAGAGKVGGNLDRHGVGLRAVLFGGDQHAADGAGLWRLIADLHGEFDPILGTRQFLGCGIFDPALSVGEKRQRPDLRQHRAPFAAQGDHQLIAVNPRARRSRLRTGQIAACSGEQRRFCRIEAAGLGTERHF